MEVTAELESQNALKEKLTTEITELSDEVAEIKAQQNKATGIRGEEKKTNEATIADAKVAQAAVEKATAVLKDFYSSHAAALVQSATDMKDEMQQAASLDPYKGQQAGSGGILGMMEVILSDFARLETETTEAESSAAAAYDKFMDESNEDVAVKETEIEHKSNKKDTAEETIRELTKNLKLTQTELDKALEYYEKLKAECVDTQVSYEERVRMREEGDQGGGEGGEVRESRAPTRPRLWSEGSRTVWSLGPVPGCGAYGPRRRLVCCWPRLRRRGTRLRGDDEGLDRDRGGRAGLPPGPRACGPAPAGARGRQGRGRGCSPASAPGCCWSRCCRGCCCCFC